jgi:hypothetical protein
MIEGSKIITLGSVDENDDMYISNRAELKHDLALFRGKQIRITITEDLINISENQRRYIFGVMAKHIMKGFYDQGTIVTHKQVVAFLKATFLFREEFSPILNDVIKTEISLSDSQEGLKRKEFTVMKENIQRWAATELQYNIPDPDPALRVWKRKEDSIF